jgi:hypothetical protein
LIVKLNYSYQLAFLYISHTGNNLPIITLDLRSDNVSTAHLIDAQTITLIVSWNDAADNQDSVPLAILVSQSANLLPCAGILPCDSNSAFILEKSSYFI